MKSINKKFIAREFLILLVTIVLSFIPLLIMLMMNLIWSNQIRILKKDIISTNKEIANYEAVQEKLKDSTDSFAGDRAKMIDFYNKMLATKEYEMGTVEQFENGMKKFRIRKELYEFFKDDGEFAEFDSFNDFTNFYGFSNENYEKWKKEYDNATTQIEYLKSNRASFQEKLENLQFRKHEKSSLITAFQNTLLILLIIVYPLRGLIMATIWSIKVLRQ